MAKPKKINNSDLPFKEQAAPEVYTKRNLASDDSTKEVVYLDSTNLADFITKLLSYLEQGYKLDFEHNDTYPVHFGYYFKVGLVKDIPQKALVDV